MRAKMIDLPAHPKRSFLHRIGRPMRQGGLHEQLMQRLLQQGIMLKLDVDGDKKRNFAIIDALTPDGTQLLLHGRELFTSAEAYQRFAASTPSPDDLMALLSKPAQEKIREFTSDERWKQLEEEYLKRIGNSNPTMPAEDRKDVTYLLDILKSAQREKLAKSLYKAIKSMTNPYDEQFLQTEREVAHIVTQSLKPRSLRHALRSRIPFVVIDGVSETSGKEVRERRPNVGGFYNPAFLKQDKDLIVVFAPMDRRSCAA